ncbi:hypothetical protein Tco_0810280, partial [Tanacetum coccineum]
MLEFKIKKPEESSLNWKPWHKDWDAITSNYSKDDDNTINDDNKYRYNSKDDDNTINNDNRYRYNRKGFLEDDERSDDSIFIVDPGWDDYSLQTIKSNRPISLCPEARRAQAHHRMSLANQKATTEYQEAIQATEDLESPAVGFAKTTDYKGGVKEMTSRRPSILNRSSTQTQTELPTQEDQIRGYRQMARNRHQVARTTRRVFGTEVLYSNNRSTARHRVYEHYSEQRYENKAAMQKKEEIWQSKESLLVRDLTDALKIIDQLTIEKERLEEHKRLEEQKDEEIRELKIIPLLLFLNILEGECIEELEGMSWHLKPPEQTSVRVPSRVAVNERLNRSVSLQFESCLNEARILEEEPLNKVIRSNKPKRSKQKSSEKWSTLGEPSGKWDYYVRYDAPPDITPIEEVAATGWGDEFSDDEVTPGKVTILEERSDWDDDERSGGKILVIQERLAQNQQEFLDEYLPQWDEQLAIQKQESGLEWENPFAAKRAQIIKKHTILHLSKEEEEEDDDLPYPKFRNFKQMAAQIIKKHEEHVFPSSSSQIESTQSYQPPHDAIMGPPVYPPWTLPPAWTESGVMLVLPADPGL